MKPRKIRMSPARYRVLQYGSVKYGFVEIPGREYRSAAEQRIWGNPTIRALIKAGLIKFRPASFYVNGRGRKLLKDYLKRTQK